jgi:hypothetical protein
MQQTTKIYENTTDKPVNVIGVGVIEAHDRISVTTEYHAPVNLVNYPGVVDVLAEEAKGTPAVAPKQEAAAAAPAAGQTNTTESEKTNE